GEDSAPAEPIGDLREDDGADEEPGKGGRGEGGLIRKAEEAGRAGVEDAAADEPGAYRGGHPQLVDLEEPAQREQRHETPDVARGRQAIEACGKRRRRLRGRGLQLVRHGYCRLLPGPVCATLFHSYSKLSTLLEWKLSRPRSRRNPSSTSWCAGSRPPSSAA